MYQFCILICFVFLTFSPHTDCVLLQLAILIRLKYNSELATEKQQQRLNKTINVCYRQVGFTMHIYQIFLVTSLNKG